MVRDTSSDLNTTLAEHAMPPEMIAEGGVRTNVTKKIFDAIASGDVEKVRGVINQYPGLNLRNPILTDRFVSEEEPRAVLTSPVLFARNKGNAEIIELVRTTIDNQDNLEARQGLFEVVENGNLEDVKTYFNNNKNMSFDYRRDFDGAQKTPIERAKDLGKSDIADFLGRIETERRLDGASIKVDPSRTVLTTTPAATRKPGK